jgi:hypothetical protein
VSFAVPDNWKAGRIWVRVSILGREAVAQRWQARRDCDFTTVNDVTSCISGGCNGGLLCDPKTGTVRDIPPCPSMCVGLTVEQGVPPATLAEWTLQGDGNRDFYDVSLVDGYNIPMRIDNTAGCPVYVASSCLVSSRLTSRAGPTASSTSARTARPHCRARSTPRAMRWDASRRAKSTRTRRTARTAAAVPITPRRPVRL